MNDRPSTDDGADAELDLGAMRLPYDSGTLRRADLGHDPVKVLRRWLADAEAAGAPEPNAMVLATADAAGMPSARTVLLKGLTADGLRFFTNRTSQKGRELATNPYAAVCFLWHQLHRQVRVAGAVQPLDEADSAAYFDRRPRDSQIGAWASPQSQPLADRATLESNFRETEKRFAGGPIHLPPFWGGFQLVPDSFEFWQGRRSRLHDRFRFQRADGGEDWVLERLAP